MIQPIKVQIFICLTTLVVSLRISPDQTPHSPERKYFYDAGAPSTGDFKTQQETRQGEVVKGSYSLLDPDGTKRTVEYTADPLNGFKAVMHKEIVPKIGAAAPGIQQYVQEMDTSIPSYFAKYAEIQDAYNRRGIPDYASKYAQPLSSVESGASSYAFSDDGERGVFNQGTVPDYSATYAEETDYFDQGGLPSYGAKDVFTPADSQGAEMPRLRSITRQEITKDTMLFEPAPGYKAPRGSIEYYRSV